MNRFMQALLADGVLDYALLNPRDDLSISKMNEKLVTSGMRVIETTIEQPYTKESRVERRVVPITGHPVAWRHFQLARLYQATLQQSAMRSGGLTNEKINELEQTKIRTGDPTRFTVTGSVEEDERMIDILKGSPSDDQMAELTKMMLTSFGFGAGGPATAPGTGAP